jgi:hypothetical protein
MLCQRRTSGILEKDDVPEVGVTYRQSVMPTDLSMRQNPAWHESAHYGRVTAAYQAPSAPRVDS